MVRLRLSAGGRFQLLEESLLRLESLATATHERRHAQRNIDNLYICGGNAGADVRDCAGASAGAGGRAHIHTQESAALCAGGRAKCNCRGARAGLGGSQLDGGMVE
eukprot:593352-Alexandrium_andersonii.AAC.1